MIAHQVQGLKILLEFAPLYSLWQSIVGSERVKIKLSSILTQGGSEFKFLDIGCGTGDFINYLPESVEYCGFDINPNYIKQANSKYGSRAKFFCCDIGEFPSFDYKFDKALVLGVLHHLSQEQSGILFERTSSLLKEGGELVCVEPVKHPQQGRLEVFLMSKDRGRYIRTQAEYKKMASMYFAHCEDSLHQSMYRFPWTLDFLRCYKGRDCQ